jgi:hypothetical protein
VSREEHSKSPGIRHHVCAAKDGVQNTRLLLQQFLCLPPLSTRRWGRLSLSFQSNKDYHLTVVEISKWLILQPTHIIPVTAEKIMILSIRFMNPSCYVWLLTALASST